MWIGIAATAGVLVLGRRRRRDLAAATSRSDLTAGNRLARSGLALLNNGDYVAAADQFDQAATAFEAADNSLSAPWAKPAVLVPGLAQNVTTAQRLASSATDASADVSAALALVDPEQLRLVNGRIDLDAIRLIQEPFHNVQDSISDLEAAIDDTASPWLIEPLRTRLDDLDAELADNGARLDNAVLAVDLAPQLSARGRSSPLLHRLHDAGGGPRPWRLHGQLGRASAVDGRLRLAQVRPHPRPQPDRRHPHGHRPRRLARAMGFLRLHVGTRRATEREPWSNITISPEFPSTAQVIAELYPQSGDTEIDGRLRHGPVRARIIAAPHRTDLDRRFRHAAVGGERGPVPARRSVRRSTTAPPRVDLLDEVARATIDQVLGGALPNPTVVARELGPVATQGRLAAWSRDPAEQRLFDQVNLLCLAPRPGRR